MFRLTAGVFRHGLSGLAYAFSMIGRILGQAIDHGEAIGSALADGLFSPAALFYRLVLEPLWHLLQIAVAPFVVILVVCLRLATGLLECSERMVGHVFACVYEPLMVVYQALVQPILRLLIVVATPFVALFEVCRYFAIGLFERCEWFLAGMTAIGLELARFFGQILWILLSAFFRLIWAVIKLIVPAAILHRLPQFHIVRNAFHTVWGTIGTFVAEWRKSRDLNKLAWSLPAIGLAGVVAMPLVLTEGYSAEDKVVRYRRSLRAAIQEEDDMRRQLILARLQQLGAHKMERTMFHIAMKDAERDGPQAVFERVQELAESEEGGLREASIWLAYKLLEGEVESKHKPPFEYVEDLVSAYSDEYGSDFHTGNIRAEIAIRRGEVHDAIDLFESMSVRGRPHVRVRLMELYASIEDWGRAKQQAGHVLDSYRLGEINDRPELSKYDRMRYFEATAILQDWRSLPERIDQVEADIDESYIAGSKVIARLTAGDVQLDPQLAKSLYRVAWTSGRLNKYLGDLLAAGTEGMGEFLQRQASLQHADSSVYRRAGDMRYASGNPSEALVYYQQAAELNPTDAVAQNNVAWLLYERGELEQSLVASMQAVEVDSNVNYLETRGLILVALEQWEDAISDLEHVLNGVASGEKKRVHKALAHAHAMIGNAELASAHRVASRSSADNLVRATSLTTPLFDEPSLNHFLTNDRTH